MGVSLSTTGFSQAGGDSDVVKFPVVDYLRATPIIDGRPDASVRSIPWRTFAALQRAPSSARSHSATYRLGYDADGLYLSLRVAKAPLVSRDRAYQNGDGFHLLLSIPEAGRVLSREFLVLGFSPLDTTRRKAFVWYRNVDLAFTRLNDARCAVESGRTESIIELFLPWAAVKPYHPWLLDSIGFNLCFVEASEAGGKVLHYARLDERFQMEQRERLVTLLPFGPPPSGIPPTVVAALERNHVTAGDPLMLRIAGDVAHEHPVRVSLEIVARDSFPVSRRDLVVVLPSPPRHRAVSVGRAAVPPGEYTVRWHTDAELSSGEEPLTVLPAVDRARWSSVLERARDTLQTGSYTTIRYLLQEMDSSLAHLQRYDPARKVLFGLIALDSLLDQARQGHDVLANRRGIIHRAYQSDLDGSLQPYTVQVPMSYTPSRRYPLLVYLHGSGEDDEGHFDAAENDGPFIRLAPFGRGTSTVYTTDHAQDDIREAIKDVCRNYSIDSTCIVLSGFSMGGYGVYRTQFEFPGKFSGLAVFSGSPDLATRWLGEGYPDFREASTLGVFRGMRMFIFHGGKDRNCPVEQTDTLVARLREAGADVEYHRESGKGHESPGPMILERYQQWLEEIMKGRIESHATPQAPK